MIIQQAVLLHRGNAQLSLTTNNDGTTGNQIARLFDHRNAFAGDHAFIHLHLSGLNDCIQRNSVAVIYLHQIIHTKIALQRPPWWFVRHWPDQRTIAWQYPVVILQLSNGGGGPFDTARFSITLPSNTKVMMVAAVS